MQFKDGAHVVTFDGQDVGSIERVVLDPQTGEVTHLVVQEGILLTEKKVLPVNWIASTSADYVTLDPAIDNLENLPRFEERHFVSPEQVEGEPPPPGHVRSLYWYPPLGSAWWNYPHYSMYQPSPYVVEKERNIPMGTVALKEGADVISKDGEHVGDVEYIFAEPVEERVTHFVISEGLLFKERKLIPMMWVTDVIEDQIHLAVTADFLDKLSEYQPES